MQKKPLMIRLIALGYLLTPIAFILQYFYFSKTPLTDVKTWRSLLDIYKITFLVFPPVIAFGIYRIRVWGWYLALAHLFFILGNNTLAFLVGSRTPPWAILTFSGLTMFVLVYFVRNAVRAPYFNPRIRWWEAKPRYAMTLQVEMGNDRVRITGETFNISEGGLFIVSDSDVKISEEFSAKLSRNGSAPVHADGQVVWVNPAGQKLPQGFGFAFTKLNREALAEVRGYIKDQKKLLRDKALYR